LNDFPVYLGTLKNIYASFNHQVNVIHRKPNTMKKVISLLKNVTLLVVVLGFLSNCASHYCPTYGKASVTKPVKRDIKKH